MNNLWLEKKKLRQPQCLHMKENCNCCCPLKPHPLHWWWISNLAGT